MLIADLTGGGSVVHSLDEFDSRSETFTPVDSSPLVFSYVLTFLIRLHWPHGVAALAYILERRRNKQEYPHPRHRPFPVRADPGCYLRKARYRSRPNPVAVSTPKP